MDIDVFLFNTRSTYCIASWILNLTKTLHLLFQVAELRSYLKSKGAEISEENSADGLITDLAKVIEASEIIFKENVPEAGNVDVEF